MKSSCCHIALGEGLWGITGPNGTVTGLPAAGLYSTAFQSAAVYSRLQYIHSAEICSPQSCLRMSTQLQYTLNCSIPSTTVYPLSCSMNALHCNVSTHNYCTVYPLSCSMNALHCKVSTQLQYIHISTQLQYSTHLQYIHAAAV
jgi:hypothetical protein